MYAMILSSPRMALNSSISTERLKDLIATGSELQMPGWTTPNSPDPNTVAVAFG